MTSTLPRTCRSRVTARTRITLEAVYARRVPRQKKNTQVPVFVEPMAALVVDNLPEGPEWLYELKFDGYRALLIKHEEMVRLHSRKDKDLTALYPGIAKAGERLDADLLCSTAALP